VRPFSAFELWEYLFPHSHMPNTRQAATKKCPFCSEDILVDAKKCKHCNEFLDQKRVRNFKGLKPALFSGIRNVSCPNCGYEGKPKTFTGGSTGVELVLWFCFLAPGVIYSVWRLSTRCYICAKCGCKEISRII